MKSTREIFKTAFKKLLPLVLYEIGCEIYHFFFQRGVFRWLWRKWCPIRFIHSSDLLFQGIDGLSGEQVLILSRILDTELWRQGKNFYWHTRLAGIDDSSMIELFDEKYALFLQKISMDGFSLRISVFQWTIYRQLGSVDGTHRLGFLLSQQNNVWIPVSINPPWCPLGIGACEWKKTFGEIISDTDMKCIVKRYEKLVADNRFWMSGIVIMEIWQKNKETIIDIFNGSVTTNG